MALTDSIKFWEGWFSDLELEVSDEQKKHLENAARIEQEAVNARAKKASDKIKAEDIILNNAVSSVAEFKKSWHQSVDQSWCKKYFT